MTKHYIPRMRLLGMALVTMAMAALYLGACSSPPPSPPGPEPGEKTAAPTPGSGTSPISIPPDQFKPTPQAVPLTPQEEAQIKIDKNEQIIANAKEGEDIYGQLTGQGFLYGRKLGQWEKAASYYERAIREYPQMSGIGFVYTELVTCYQQLKDQDRLNKLYLRMMEVFPQDSQEYLLAKQGLGQ